MAEGDADPDATGAGEGADAGQDTGADGDADQAGDGQTGATGADQPDGNPFQEGYNRGAKETREALEGKIDSLEQKNQQMEQKLDELSGNPGKAKAEGDEDLYTEDQVEELRSNYQSKLEQREQAIQQANRATARNKLVEALHEQGVIKAEMFADLLVDRGRVQADVTEGLDHVQVLTPEGNKMLTPDGEEADVSHLARQWAESNPEFVRDGTQNGAGFDEGSDPQPVGDLTERQRRAEQEGDLNSASEAKAARAIEQMG